MITSRGIYWITRLDSINGLFFGATVIFITSLILFLIILVPAIVEEMDELKKICKKGIITSVVCLILFSTTSTLLPTTKEAIAIWAIPKIVNNEEVQQIPENFAKLINDKLQDWMEDVGIEENKSIDKSD